MPACSTCSRKAELAHWQPAAAARAIELQLIFGVYLLTVRKPREQLREAHNTAYQMRFRSAHVSVCTRTFVRLCPRYITLSDATVGAIHQFQGDNDMCMTKVDEKVPGCFQAIDNSPMLCRAQWLYAHLSKADHSANQPPKSLT